MQEGVIPRMRDLRQELVPGSRNDHGLQRVGKDARQVIDRAEEKLKPSAAAGGEPMQRALTAVVKIRDAVEKAAETPPAGQ